MSGLRSVVVDSEAEALQLLFEVGSGWECRRGCRHLCVRTCVSVYVF